MLSFAEQSIRQVVAALRRSSVQLELPGTAVRRPVQYVEAPRMEGPHIGPLVVNVRTDTNV